MVSMTVVLVKTFYRIKINFVTLNDLWFYNLHYHVNTDLAVFIAKYLFYGNMYEYSHKNIFSSLKIAKIYLEYPRQKYTNQTGVIFVPVIHQIWINPK